VAPAADSVGFREYHLYILDLTHAHGLTSAFPSSMDLVPGSSFWDPRSAWARRQELAAVPTDPSRYVPVAHPVSSGASAEALRRAVSAARQAPSAHNAQPWRWRLSGDVLDLFVEPRRMAGAAEPDERLAVIGCGAALQHARLVLAASGWRVTVTRQPDDADPDHVARLHIDAAARISQRAVRAARQIRLRHTDQRPVTGEPLRSPDLAALTAAVESEGSHLHVLGPDQILRLVLASAPADDLDPVEAQWHDELARWSGRGRTVGTGEDVPIPRQLGTRDRPVTFAALFGLGDDRPNWLRAGESLSAAWLAATEMQISLLPLSAPIERPAAREALRAAVGHLCRPLLVIRLGRHTGVPAAPSTPRLPLDQILWTQAADTAGGHQ
jgi:nitroreductase